jgi:hypothetical protein
MRSRRESLGPHCLSGDSTTSTTPKT